MIVASFPVISQLETILRHVLNWLHTTAGLSWAWSIVGLTVIVRMILVPLTVRQIHSMQNLQRHAPQMKEIQRKYKGDRQRMNQEMMKFYKENNINPASSCLPLLAQFPVFISLYLVLKHYHFTGNLGWLGIVPDITAPASSHWSGYLLIAIYAASQIASTLFMSTTMDRTQRTILLLAPLVFITIVIRFPTGLVIYWVTTNLWTVGQGLVTRRLVPKTPAPQLEKRSSRTPPKAETDGRPKAEEAKAAGQQKPAQPQQVRRVKRKKKRSSGRR